MVWFGLVWFGRGCMFWNVLEYSRMFWKSPKSFMVVVGMLQLQSLLRSRPSESEIEIELEWTWRHLELTWRWSRPEFDNNASESSLSWGGFERNKMVQDIGNWSLDMRHETWDMGLGTWDMRHELWEIPSFEILSFQSFYICLRKLCGGCHWWLDCRLSYRVSPQKSPFCQALSSWPSEVCF